MLQKKNSDFKRIWTFRFNLIVLFSKTPGAKKNSQNHRLKQKFAEYVVIKERFSLQDLWVMLE